MIIYCNELDLELFHKTLFPKNQKKNGKKYAPLVTFRAPLPIETVCSAANVWAFYKHLCAGENDPSYFIQRTQEVMP